MIARNWQGSGKGGLKLKLGMAEVAVQTDALHAREPDGWRKTRLLAVNLAARGGSTSAQIAEVWQFQKHRFADGIKRIVEP